ncbi:hypothetical protein K435DRAFT_772314 [Dendrothele bispora CBS 962.96]|uniref:Lysine decarboxylase n=1 Tax=Dendrothele bispora (strain CBS 962.96) TaxID=1314807 RepID=A0A4S8MXP2_DENBC|nr:hypothetical protein K435DRAFT_772314 [Dendrothele bispora CBS 962.96]
MSDKSGSQTTAIAVYCGSSTGKELAYTIAATSVGAALAKANRRLIYGGGYKGLMGAVSNAVLSSGGKITGVIPSAMVAAGGEEEKGESSIKSIPVNPAQVTLESTDNAEWIITNSMHERKVEMAKRACGFIGLPGGFGTFEEVVEVTTWTQLGIHNKPVVLLNVLSFYEPLRALIKTAVSAGFIQPYNEALIVFVDGPASFNATEHENFDWGSAALNAIEKWQEERAAQTKPLFDWTKGGQGEALSST